MIPGAILFSRDEHDGGWVFKEYLEVGTANLPDGAYFGDSIRKLCVMPVSGTEIKGLAEKIISDYNNASRNELLMQNLKKHLMARAQIGVSLKKQGGGAKIAPPLYPVSDFFQQNRAEVCSYPCL